MTAKFEIALTPILTEQHAGSITPSELVAKLLHEHKQHTGLDEYYVQEELCGLLARAYASEGMWDDFEKESEKIGSSGVVTALLLDAFCIAEEQRESDEGLKVVLRRGLRHFEQVTDLEIGVTGQLEHKILEHLHLDPTIRSTESARKIECSARARAEKVIVKLSNQIGLDCREKDDFLDGYPYPKKVAILFNEAFEYSKKLKKIDPFGYLEFQNDIIAGICEIKNQWADYLKIKEKSGISEEALTQEVIFEACELYEFLISYAEHQFLSSSSAIEALKTLEALDCLIPRDITEKTYDLPQILKVFGRIDSILFVIENTSSDIIKFTAADLLNQNRNRIGQILNSEELTEDLEERLIAYKSYLEGWLRGMMPIREELPSHIPSEPLVGTIDKFDEALNQYMELYVPEDPDLSLALIESLSDYDPYDVISSSQLVMAQLLDFSPSFGDSQFHRDQFTEFALKFVGRNGVSIFDLESEGPASHLIGEVRRLHSAGNGLDAYILLNRIQDELLNSEVRELCAEVTQSEEEVFDSEDDGIETNISEDVKTELVMTAGQVCSIHEALSFYQKFVLGFQDPNDRLLFMISFIRGLTVPRIIET